MYSAAEGMGILQCRIWGVFHPVPLLKSFEIINEKLIDSCLKVTYGVQRQVSCNRGPDCRYTECSRRKLNCCRRTSTARDGCLETDGGCDIASTVCQQYPEASTPENMTIREKRPLIQVWNFGHLEIPLNI